MHGIVSLLDQAHNDQIETSWQLLRGRCGLSGVMSTPYPHFSWQIAEDYDWQRLNDALVGLAQVFPPLQVRTSGLGLFTGENPVLYIPVVRTRALSAMHDRIWKATQSTGDGISSYYAPDSWMPHITIADRDADPAAIGCAIQLLARQKFDWVIAVDTLAVIYAPGDQVATLRSRFQLQGKSPVEG